MFCQVGQGDCDLGVAAISLKADRATIIEYTMSVGDDGMVWVSLPPQKLPPITNITWIFDFKSWICIMISIVMVIIAFIIITRVSLNGSKHYISGAEISYRITIGQKINRQWWGKDFQLLYFRTLNAFYPNWFGKSSQVVGGLSGKGLFFIWSVVLLLYIWMFESLLLSMMMKPIMEGPIDTTKENSPFSVFGSESSHNVC